MKKLIITCLLLLGVCAALLLPNPIPNSVSLGKKLITAIAYPAAREANRTANQFYTSLVASNYERAFAVVGYYDSYPDMVPTTSYSTAEITWINRVVQLEKHNISFLKLVSVDIFMDDNYPMGNATIEVMVEGERKTIVQFIHFADRSGEKIQAVRSNAALPVLDQALSGDVSATMVTLPLPTAYPAPQLVPTPLPTIVPAYRPPAPQSYPVP